MNKTSELSAEDIMESCAVFFLNLTEAYRCERGMFQNFYLILFFCFVALALKKMFFFIFVELLIVKCIYI